MPGLLSRAAGAAVLVVFGLAPAAAQDVPVRAGPISAGPMPVRDDLPPAGAVPEAARPRRALTPSATFVITFEAAFPPDARTAFQAAADVWAQYVASDVPIRIDARWRPLGAEVLGAAGPFLVRDFSGAPVPGTWYASALADAVARRDVDPGRPDIQATFNSQFERWHLDPHAPLPFECSIASPPPTARCFDLYTVVLHELGHGLGFIGSLKVEGGLGLVGSEPSGGGADGIPFAYDRRTEDLQGRPLLQYGHRSPGLAAALERPTYFDGPVVRSAYEDRAPLYSPPRWVSGTSYSHLDEQAFPTGHPNALMTPFIVRNERIAAPDALACGVLADIGWPLGEGCTALLPDRPTPPVESYSLTLAPGAPNPFVASTALLLTSDRGGLARVQLYDALGRRVADLPELDLDPGVPTWFEVPGGRAAGVYFVRVLGDGFTAVLPVTQVR